MFIVVYILFALSALGGILFVLLQTPKQSGLTSSMGGSSNLFGGQGVEGGLVRVTSVLCGLFLVFSLVLNLITP